MIRIALFASGTGTNAQELIRFFKNDDAAKVVLLVCNNSEAGALKVAKQENVNVFLLNNQQLQEDHFLLHELKNQSIDFIVLAGFLRKIPSEIISFYKGKIINIHPALLPKFGGKGMYGNRVHEAVLTAAEKESGITIHHVTEDYDEGAVIFQASCSIDKNETVESLAQKIHQLEHEHFPRITKQQILLCQV